MQVCKPKRVCMVCPLRWVICWMTLPPKFNHATQQSPFLIYSPYCMFYPFYSDITHMIKIMYLTLHHTGKSGIWLGTRLVWQYTYHCHVPPFQVGDEWGLLTQAVSPLGRAYALHGELLLYINLHISTDLMKKITPVKACSNLLLRPTWEARWREIYNCFCVGYLISQA